MTASRGGHAGCRTTAAVALRGGGKDASAEIELAAIDGRERGIHGCSRGVRLDAAVHAVGA